jgi:hypothetical protein
MGIFRQLPPEGKILEGATMSRIAKSCTLFRLAVLLCWLPLFGQSAPATQPTTFHITGAISGFENEHSFAVVFDGVSSKTVITNEAGVYEANLPLGLWTMTVVAHGPDGKIFTNMVCYRRPPFRVTAPTSIVFDISLPQGTVCDMHVFGRDGGPPTQEEKDQVKAWCAGEEFFSVPSDGVTFEVHVWGGRDFGACSLASNNSTVCKHTFATYNTLSVQADRVVFTPFPSGGILEANGSVVANDSRREYRRNSIRFLIGGGQAVKLQ